MISPFKIARDALATRSNGATKYVDEFFTWREVAHAFCFRSWPVLESTQVGLPLLSLMLQLLLWQAPSHVLTDSLLLLPCPGTHFCKCHLVDALHEHLEKHSVSRWHTWRGVVMSAC
jgi:hypothetical protein